MATKTERQLAGIMKGVSNHRRVQALRLLEQEPELSVDQIAQRLRINFRTASDHIRRMSTAGLLMKRHEGRWVRHKLSRRGADVLAFLAGLE